MPVGEKKLVKRRERLDHAREWRNTNLVLTSDCLAEKRLLRCGYLLKSFNMPILMQVSAVMWETAYA